MSFKTTRKKYLHPYVWYSGAIFRNVLQNQSAYIHSLSNDLHVYVYGTEEYYSLNEYLTPICNTIRKINKDMRLSFEEFLTYRVSNKEFEFLYEEVEGNLRNNMYQRYDARIKGIIDYRDIARRFMNDGSKIDTILQLILNSLKKMQGNMVYYRNDKNGRGLEDDRNRFVSSCLTIAGYLCNDKQPQGVSNGGRASGECDFVVKNKKKQDVLIYEGLILRFMDRGYINTHIEKLLKNYNTSGLPKGVLVIYLECGRDRFKGFTENYREYISGYAPDLYECIGVPQIIPTEEEYLVCMEMYYEIGGLSFSIYHIIVRIAP